MDAIATGAQGNAGAEFGYVLRRTVAARPAAERAVAFEYDVASWRNSRRPLFSRPPAATSARVTLVVDTPEEGAAVGDQFVIGGWAAGGPRGGSAIDVIEAWAVGASGSEHFLGWTSTGGARPDVARAVGAHAATAGYTMSVAGLPAGVHQVAVAARGPLPGDALAVNQRRLTVS